MGARHRALIGAIALVSAGALLAFDLIAQMPQSRTIALRNIHTDETITVEYKRNGRYVPEAMERINWVMRDWRRDEATKMDPALVDLIWEMHHELGSRQPINIISAYRSRATNNMLRTTRGGQASESRHMLGKAADVQFPDVPVKHLRYAAMVRERGGVGYYPTGATPFIHVDTDRVRAWPRMPRFELALLFPNGRTQHKPAEGGDLTADDVRTARARQPEVAVQLAAFHDLRRKGREQPSLVAALAPGAGEIVLTPAPAARPQPQQRPPQLVGEPRLAERPVRLVARPSEEDRRTLTQLVALSAIPQLVTQPTLAARPAVAKRKGHLPDDVAAERVESPYPRLAFLSPNALDAFNGWSSGFAPAPAWDEDHPEEAAYRPFPIAAFLTASASIDDPSLAKLVHPDLARTGELFENSGTVAPLKLRPAGQVAQLLWKQGPTGEAIDLAQLSNAATGDTARAAATSRRVQTEPAR